MKRLPQNSCDELWWSSCVLSIAYLDISRINMNWLGSTSQNFGMFAYAWSRWKRLLKLWAIMIRSSEGVVGFGQHRSRDAQTIRCLQEYWPTDRRAKDHRLRASTSSTHQIFRSDVLELLALLVNIWYIKHYGKSPCYQWVNPLQMTMFNSYVTVRESIKDLATLTE